SDYQQTSPRTVETLAGNSSSACPGGGGSTCGDGGAATSALLIAPRGVAVANTGDVFIADTGAGRVRRVQASDGTILSFAGSGASATSAPRSWLSLPLPASSVAIRPVAVVVDQSGRVLIAEAALDGTGTAAVTSAIWIVPTVSLTQSFPHTSSGMIAGGGCRGSRVWRRRRPGELGALKWPSGPGTGQHWPTSGGGQAQQPHSTN
ncbi:unnamed protein product, partial [Polarella glacialis]